jgi:site-specific DNA-methyltransferase (adenine-specific)
MTGQGQAPHQEGDFRVDDEFAALIPPLTDEERKQLEANLLADGCREPLVVWQEEGILLDGHNRYRVCREHHIAFDVRKISLPSRDAAKLWIRLNQLGRRNLTDDQRAIIADEVREDMAKAARAASVQRAGLARHGKVSVEATVAPTEKPRVREQIARKAHVSERKLRKAKAVRQASPALAEKVRRGETTLNKAVKEIRKQAKEQAKATLPADLPAATDRYRVIHAEFRRADVGIGSADWIITDPPYEKKYLSLYADLSEFAARVLKPGGSLLAMVGQSYLPEILQLLSRHLTYHWALAYHTPGGQAVQLWDRKVNTFWKPVLWFVKDRYEGDWIGDVCSSAVNDNDKRFHEWGQSESGMADIIERFTYPGQTICDPFCGGGTTGVVAVRMNRLFIGIDRDGDAVATTLQRLAEVARA